jgi:hypothetical protein
MVSLTSTAVARLYGTLQNLGGMKAGKKGGEDSLGLVIDSESGESYLFTFPSRYGRWPRKRLRTQV